MGYPQVWLARFWELVRILWGIVRIMLGIVRLS